MMSVRNPNLSDDNSDENNGNQDVNIWGQNNPMYKGEFSDINGVSKEGFSTTFYTV